jgi:PAS domain S-box-containing protein
MISNYTADYRTATVNTFNDLIFLCDEEGMILDFTEQENSEWLPIPPKKVTGKHHAEVLHPDVSKKISGALNVIRNGKRNVSFDYSHHIDGKTAWFTADLSPMLKEPDQPAKYICVIREITARKEKELLLQGVLDNAFNSFKIRSTG